MVIIDYDYPVHDYNYLMPILYLQPVAQVDFWFDLIFDLYHTS